MKKDKDKLIDMLLKRKIDPEHNTFRIIERETGYSKKQISRVNKQLEKKDKEEIKIHGNAGKKPATTASDQEISYIINFNLSILKSL